MRFGGMQKLTTLDFPGVVSALVFTQGCNFHCPYCHNAQLIPATPAPEGDLAPDREAVLAFLKKRADVLDGVVISGGEPCMQTGLADFCRKVKALGYKVKLDTNGAFPSVLETLLADNCLDYVAVDVKTAPHAYAPAICRDAFAGEKLAQSLALLGKSALPHEVRTTCVAPFVTHELMEEAARLVGPAIPWYLQKATLTDEQQKSGIRALDDVEITALANVLRPRSPFVTIR